MSLQVLTSEVPRLAPDGDIDGGARPTLVTTSARRGESRRHATWGPAASGGTTSRLAGLLYSRQQQRGGNPARGRDHVRERLPGDELDPPWRDHEAGGAGEQERADLVGSRCLGRL